ncbi:S9 family peptidase [Thalassotalea sp. LPB0316]|uniref:alpha/beta hydrolase family protein n=1 Tax=Thalassotalea sp. LPB0316 TaxID=2769490 RepID=UPI001869293C|nr:prolyl oligopeptidase family serine peptidase [Thalassotalea sp. LPB0316]QOL25877.1 S9 family peptidase [Thalassotalea sp. LPB0316]
MRKVFHFILTAALLCGTSLKAEATSAADAVEAFSILPMIRSVSVSPDGKQIAIVRASTKNGDYYIEIRQTKDLTKDPVKLGASKMLVSGVSWLNNEKIAVSFRQILRDGASSYWVGQFAITDADGKGDWLVPFQSKKNIRGYQIIDPLPNDPNEVLVEVDINANYIPDVVRMNVKTGRTKMVLRGNTKRSGGFTPDADGEIRAATGWNASEDTIDIFARKQGDDDWQLVFQNSPSDRSNFDFLGFNDENPNEIWVNANRGQNTTGIYLYNLETKKYSERLFGLENVDVDGVMFDRFGKSLGFTYTTKQPKRYFLDLEMQSLYQGIEALFPGEFVSLSSYSDDYNQIVIRTSSAKNPGTYYLLSYKQTLNKIGDVSPQIKPDMLSEVKYISYKTRDGLKQKAYVTLPTKGKAPYPTVVMPHGGPWARDVNIYDPWTQLLASQGYMVVQPQFRGSTGYGMKHWKDGDKQWGLIMQDDMDDSALYLVKKGLADKNKLGMFGWSYGGYSAFAASMRENNIYQCSIAGAGVSNLDRINSTLNESRFLRELQKPTIEGVSPIDQVEKVNIPILVVHGDIDERVPVIHSREFVDELKRLNKDHKYVELQDADHFSDTLFYDHKKEFYGEMLDWFTNKCGF